MHARFSARAFATIFLLTLSIALMAQSSAPQSPGAGADSKQQSGRDFNISFKDVKPSNTLTELQGQGYTLGYPENWKTATGKDSTIIGPPEAMVDAGIAYGVIVGTNLSSEADSLDAAVQHLAQGLAQQNPGMKISGEMKHITSNGVEGRSQELTGNSPLQKNGQPLPERDWLVALPRGDGGLLYLVFVSPERDFNQLHPIYQKMLDSIRLK
jgi:hypothetical protein